MYLGALTGKITIAGKYVLHGANHIEIKRSIHQSIQTAKVTVPLSVLFRNKELLKRIKLVDKIQEGDSIKLEFGYDGIHNLEFEGYIRRINDGTPVVLECEDELYLLRKVYYKESFKNISLKELVEFLLRGLEQKFDLKLAAYENLPQMSFSKFMIKEANGIEVLQELKDKYGLTCYLTTINGKKTLYTGLAYSLEKGRVKYLLGSNTIDKGDLKFEGSEDKKYKIKVVNFSRSGLKTEFEIGDANGELRTLNFYGDNDKSHLQEMAKAEMEKFQTKGYKGSFDTFLSPFSEPGLIGELSDPQFPDRKGNYYIGTVTTTFGTGGGRRKVEVDIKTSAK